LRLTCKEVQPTVIQTDFHNRRAFQIENDAVRVTVIAEGGHIAEILEKNSGVNPLWIPPWPSIEISSYAPQKHPEYGADSESKLLAGIMGHNLCLDMFGPPSDAEAAAGMTVHGEASVVPYGITSTADGLVARCMLPIAQLRCERRVRLEGRRVLITETVENLSALDRPIAWTEHVTLGPPFLQQGATEFRVSATKSRALGESADFDWPFRPSPDGKEDLRIFTNATSSGGYTAHLMNPAEERAWFWARSPASRVLLGYVWERSDFPWIGIWEENNSRTNPPWNGRTVTRGMEFGASPFPETRREMVEREKLFDAPCYRWLPAKRSLSVEYYAAVMQVSAIPETLVQFEAAVAGRRD
jgi:hypothetical protein